MAIILVAACETLVYSGNFIAVQPTVSIGGVSRLHPLFALIGITQRDQCSCRCSLPGQGNLGHCERFITHGEGSIASDDVGKCGVLNGCHMNKAVDVASGR